MKIQPKIRVRSFVSDDFKVVLAALIFFITSLHLFDTLYLPAIPLVSDVILLSIVLLAVTYLWVQEVRSRREIRIKGADLYSEKEANMAAMKALVVSEEARDPYLSGHSQRVTEYALAIANRMNLGDTEKKHIEYAGYLHDIGKLSITDAILHKKGHLNEEEWKVIKRHPETALEILASLNFLHEKIIIKHHHERYDGKGYPDGLKGKAIPLGSRILGVADAFDAMNSKRPYRPALPKEKIISELINARGTQFDSEIVDIFLDVIRSDDSIFRQRAEVIAR